MTHGSTYRNRNTQYYELVTEGDSPVSLEEAKDYMKITTTADDALITLLIDSCTQWGEKYTGRDFRENVWSVLLDFFEKIIEIRRNPIKSIDSVKYINDAETPIEITVDDSVYYEKKLTQVSQIRLQVDQEWPTDVLDQDQQISIAFTTEAVISLEVIEQAILRHVAYMYENRGDCGSDCGGCADAAGVNTLYNMFRIARV